MLHYDLTYAGDYYQKKPKKIQDSKNTKKNIVIFFTILYKDKKKFHSSHILWFYDKNLANALFSIVWFLRLFNE